MTIRTNPLSTRLDLNSFTAMRLDLSTASEEVMDFDEQSLWHDTEMHSDRDMQASELVKTAALEPTGSR